ncbi:MAG: efflux RND transporter permease subunit [Verrucomicrobia bacterium]|nr:efflux RND transporter permease subunit [Verrucomicrobiota bacterium]
MVVGGAVSLFSIKMELFPQFSLDTIVVRVPYLGASPEEVEEAVNIRIEEALQGLEGIKELRSSASEGYGAVSVVVDKGYDLRKVKEDVKTRVDAITTFPANTERPIIDEFLIQRDTIWIAISGDTDELTLKHLAKKVRDDVVELPGVSQAFTRGVRDYEISINVSENKLRQYGLTFDQVMQVVQGNSLDLPAGQIRSTGGEILLRTKEQAYRGNEFEELVLISRPDGTQVRLSDVAEIEDGFEDVTIFSSFNGKAAALVLVREVGRESPLNISAQIYKYVEESKETWLPDGIELMAWGDSAFYLEDRLNLLLENGAIGFVLVLISLSLFLRPSLAFFVAAGIPVSFLATFLVGPVFGLSINLISLFAFILVLGIVVDDAIVVGESVFSEFQRNGSGVESAIRGTHLVSTPVTFAVLTTIVAFCPIFFLPGLMGKFFVSIPLVVIPTLLFSLVQSKLVLPYHLSLCNVGSKRNRDELNLFSRFQRKISDSLEAFIRNVYDPFVEVAINWRYATLGAFIAILIVSWGIVAGGWIRFVQFPNVPSDFILVQLEMPEGTSSEDTGRAMEKLVAGLDQVREEAKSNGEHDPVAHYMVAVGYSTMTGGPNPESTVVGSNIGSIVVELAKDGVRDSNAFEVADQWRKLVGQIPGASRLTMNAGAAGPVGLPVDIRLTGPDFNQLKQASLEIQKRLQVFEGLNDIRDTYSEGKQEIKIKLKDSARGLGLNASDLARQVRQAFYGGEAQRIQRDQDDVRIMVRYPKSERESIGNLERMYIRTPSGQSVPMNEVADIEFGHGYPGIARIDRQRVINVQADADKDVANPTEINKVIYPMNQNMKRMYEMFGQEVQPSILEEVLANYPGVRSIKDGEAKDFEELMPVLLLGGFFVIVIIYTLLAIPFKSYVQPILVISAIPFGIAGAIFGHLINFQNFGTPQDLSTLSMLGIIALSGVVVNDSLVLVDYINKLRAQGVPLKQAVHQGGIARFRPILLTSLTTFVGLVPILLESSLQAQFLIPMATSLSFGVLFATFITLLLVPALYLILEDVMRVGTACFRWLLNLYFPKKKSVSSSYSIPGER